MSSRKDAIDYEERGQGQTVTLEEVSERVDKVRELVEGRHNESAHVEENLLWRDVLTTVANGVDYPDELDPVELAKLALETDTVDYSRWFA